MSPFAEYLAAIRKKLAQGDATEQTHRAALEHLLEAVGKGITATNEPKRIACGAPDFNITRHKVPLGHIETKDIGISLDDMERGKGANGEQFKRYRDALPNWILTDYLEFRWFVAGEKRLTVRLAEFDGSGKVRALPEGEQRLAVLLDSFFNVPALTVGTAKELAERMAGMTRNLRDLITATFALGAGQDKDWLQNWLTSFREVLIPELDEPQFADMFAQTLAYGLFAARIHTPTGKTFSREMAAFSLPKTNPFLRKLFAEFAGVDMPETFGWAVDDVVELLKHAAMDEVLKDFGKGKGKEDPVVHFYETFLAAYDPKMRELRGVYYTPEPVVSYIVRSIDYLLKTRFNRPKGLADENTLILDPATGTATFLYFVVRQIYGQFASQKGAWDSYVSEHLLNRLFGFELLMAPYAIAHLKLGLELQETGYSFGSATRLGIYLTNTLEEVPKKSEKLIAKWISDEANEASEIKRDRPILVILGNPPYSGHSANRSQVVRQLRPGDSYKVVSGGPLRANKVTKILTAKTAKTVREKTFIGDLIDDYKVVDGAPLREKNPKWLQDDYVKFIRWSQWRIELTGYGILAMITNHKYLDNTTFRGMRQALLQAFNEIYVYDLHGNKKKKERAPAGGKDDNVFDIQQGVAIILAIKKKGDAGRANVRHSHLWDSRKGKYDLLSQTSIKETSWVDLAPHSPAYLFIPQKQEGFTEYDRAWKITEIMPINSLGIATARDELTVQLTKGEVRAVIDDFSVLSTEEARAKYDLGEDARDWKVELAQADLMQSTLKDSNIVPILYRPFDLRFTYYTGKSRGFHCMPRGKVMHHVLAGKNLVFSTSRGIEIPGFEHAFCSRHVIGHHAVSLKEVNYCLPLYLHPPARPKKRSQGELGLDSTLGANGFGERHPNLNPTFLVELSKRLGLNFVSDGKGDLASTFGPEDVFDYMYAVFYSPAYRKRYAEFLKSDFPRVPLTSDRCLFIALAGKGSELVALHVMESPKLDQSITIFPEKGSNVVEKVAYIDATQRVCINGIQYFQGVTRDAWEFHIGGYQVLEKWLKDRKGRELTWDDIQYYQKVVVALTETIRLMAEIDAVIEAHGGWPLQ